MLLVLRKPSALVAGPSAASTLWRTSILYEIKTINDLSLFSHHTLPPTFSHPPSTSIHVAITRPFRATYCYFFALNTRQLFRFVPETVFVLSAVFGANRISLSGNERERERGRRSQKILCAHEYVCISPPNSGISSERRWVFEWILVLQRGVECVGWCDIRDERKVKHLSPHSLNIARAVTRPDAKRSPPLSFYLWCQNILLVKSYSRCSLIKRSLCNEKSSHSSPHLPHCLLPVFCALALHGRTWCGAHTHAIAHKAKCDVTSLKRITTDRPSNEWAHIKYSKIQRLVSV